jgi:thioredoxin-related protein
MRTVTVAIVVLLVAVSAGSAFAWDVPAGIKWLPDFEAALKTAATSGKPVMANFVSQYCEFCRDMDQEVLPTADITGLLKKFDCVRVDADKRDDLVMKYKAFRVPAYLILDAKGEVIAEFSGYYPADVFGVKVRDALHLWQARPELQKLQAKREADTATPAQLARLGYLLRRGGRNAQAREVLNAALKALPQDDPLRANVDLDLSILAASDGSPEGLGKLEGWVFANPKSPRRWEAQFELGMAQANGSAVAQAVSNFNQIVAATPDSSWGIMSKYFAALLGPEVEQPKTGG